MIPNQYFKIKLEISNFFIFQKSTLAVAAAAPKSFVFFAELSQEDKKGLVVRVMVENRRRKYKVKSFLLVIFLNPLIKKRLGSF